MRYSIAILLLFAMSWQFASAQIPSWSCSPTDIDIDDDGLIDICYLEGLNAIRYQLNGTGYRASAGARKVTTGCPSNGCNGYELMRDLDFNDDAGYSSTSNKVLWTVDDYEDSTDSGWQPIGYLNPPILVAFMSIFEGNGHTISNLKINRPNTSYVGLFGYIFSNAEIRNIGLLNIDIKGHENVGGLVGYNFEGSVVGNSVSGNVTGNRLIVGGLVGYNFGGSVVGNSMSGSVTGNRQVGGLVGDNAAGSVVDNSVSGSVTGNQLVGGLVGWNSIGSVAGNFVSGSVRGSQSVGGLAGENTRGGVTTDNRVYAKVRGGGTLGGLVGRNTGRIVNSHVSGSVIGGQQLGGLAGYNAGSITGSSAGKGVKGDEERMEVAGSEYVGGLVGYNFNGNIDDSYAINDVTGRYDHTGGLVGFNENSAIDNSYSIGNVEGINRVGGLIGWNKDSRITGGYSEGNVAGEGENDAGGLIGYNQSGTIIGGYSVGDVTGVNHAGGLIGRNHGTITGAYAVGDVAGRNDVGGLIGISQSGTIAGGYTVGDVTGVDHVGGLIGRHTAGDIVEGYASGDVEGRHNVGGLVGKNDGNTRTINSYAGGNVAGSGNAIGGLVGHNDGNIDNSYAAGNVAREQNVTGDEQVGGLVGRNGGNIGNSYAAGNIIGDRQVGGLVGLHSGRIINSYSRGNVEALVGAVSGGGNSSNSYWRSASGSATDGQGGRGFNADQLRRPTQPNNGSHPYNQWGTNNWDFGSSEQYPALKYTEGSDTNNPACGSAAGLSDCDTLLYGQRIGLSALDVVGGAILLPSFNSEVLDYRVINSSRLQQIQLIATAVNSNVTITVRSIGGFSITVASGATSAVIPLNMEGTTVITIEVAEERGELVRYTLDVNNNTIDEGERIVLDGEAIYGSDNDSLSYRWTQVSGVSILSGVAVDQSLLDLTLSADLLDRTTVATAIVLRLEVIEANAVIDSEDIALTIAKIDNGVIRLSVAPTLQGAILTAPEIDLSADPDGAASIDGYQWQKRLNGRINWVDVESATDRTYRIPTDTPVNTDYRVQFSYSDGQGYVKQIASPALTYKLDIDADDNGLIEINDLEDLNAVRYQLDGTGYKASDVVSKITTGCRLVNNQETCNGYELARDLDFNDDGSYGLGIANKADWTIGLGWRPIGTADKPFNTIFRANNHTISNLYIRDVRVLDAQSDMGLFGATGDKAEIADIGLLNVDITGKDGVAGLIGYKQGGAVSNSYVTGRVSGEGLYDVGGLVGWHLGGTITDSYTSSTVVGLSKNSGGLVGDNDGGTITNSYALGSVSAGQRSGGLVGRNSGTVAQSYASVAVEGSGAVGGLVGYNDKGAITNSRATGDVTGHVDVGGLLGWSSGDITNSYAIGAVAGNAAVGGLIGNNLGGTITNSYARGDVSGRRQYIGGLIGWHSAGTITDSYAWGDVFGQEDVGGLVGVNNLPTGLVAKSYAVGRVVGEEDAGGLVGNNIRGTITKSYWNITNNPTTTSAGGTSKTSIELQTPTVAGSTATETYYDWHSDDWDFALPTRYPILRHAVGADKANPACGAGDDLPDCGTLLSGQLPPVGLSELTLSEGAMLSLRFSGEVYDYHVDVGADTQFLSVQFMASDAAARIRIKTDGGITEDNASSGTLISLNADSATLITIIVMAEYSITSEYRLYVNRIPEIVAMGLDTSVDIKAGREHAINVTVSDADREDILTLSLRAVGENRGIVELTTTTVTVSASGSVARVRQSLGIKGLKAGSTMLALTVRDKYAVSSTVLLTVTVEANTAPTINDLTDIRLVAETEAIVAVILGDDDDDDSLKASVSSSNEAVATVSIAETGGANRILTVIAGRTSGTAEITVVADDGRGVANSVVKETFTAIVEANEVLVLTVKSPTNQTITPGGTANLIVSVWDANFDANDSIVLEAVSSTLSVVSVQPARIGGIRDDTDRTFVLTGMQAGMATITITAMDNEGMRVSKIVSVYVNTAPTINDLADIRLLSETEATVAVTLSDADADDAGRLKTSVKSSNEAIAAASIAETGGATRVLTVTAGSTGGTAEITVMTDDGRGAANSVVSETFEVSVEANQAPMLTIKSPTSKAIRLFRSTISESIVVSVSDANFDVNDSVVLEAVSSSTSVVSVKPVRIVGIRGDTDKTFVATGLQAGTTMIRITATDSKGASTSETVSVHVNASPIITSYHQNIWVKAGRVQLIGVSVSDADLDDVITLSLSAYDDNQRVVELTKASVEVLPNGNVARDRQSLAIRALQAGSTDLAITVRDESRVSLTASLTVTVGANATPTISGLSDIRLLTDAETTLNVTLDDEDDDDASRLKASVRSSNEAIATAHIAETGDATRVLTVNAGSMVGTATITVLADDGRGVANSVISETFKVSVEANEAPTLEIKSPINQTIILGSTASLVVSVADANFDVNNSIVLEAMSSPTSVVSIQPTRIVEVNDDADRTFILTGVQAGTARISITATDSIGMSMSKTVSVHVNAPPVLAIDDDEVTVKAGREGLIDVTVSDANRKDVLTLLLSTTDESQDIVELATTNATVSANGSIARAQQSFGIKGLKAGSTDLLLTVSDEYGASATVMLTVTVGANATPTIEGLSNISLLTNTETTLNVTLSDADDDDIDSLRVTVRSSNAAIATASIAETGGATRVLTVTAGSMSGTAVITVMIDDGRGVANSVISETFKVSVEMNEAPIIGTLAPMSVAEGDTIDASEAVSDVNNDDLSYWWEITNEADGSAINVDDSSLFVVPTDLVKPPAEATTLTLMLTVSDGATDVSTKVSVLVRSVNNGAAIPTVLIRDGLELMPPTIDLSADPDGAGSSATYVWQVCSANCSVDGDWSAIGEVSDSATAYTIAEGQAGYRFRLKVDYIDGQGYENVIFYNGGIRIRAKVFLEGPLQ